MSCCRTILEGVMWYLIVILICISLITNDVYIYIYFLAYWLCVCVCGWVCVCAHTHALSCPTLCDPIDYTPPAPLSMGFSKQEYWSGLPFPSPGDLSDRGMEPTSLASPGGSVVLLVFLILQKQRLNIKRTLQSISCCF